MAELRNESQHSMPSASRSREEAAEPVPKHSSESVPKHSSESVPKHFSEPVPEHFSEPVSEPVSGALFVSDCSVESDLEMYFPDTYVPGSSERMLLYRELDNIEDDRTLEAYRQRLEDRFGPVPHEGEELMQVVLLRRLGKQLGCEKIILRQGLMNMQFVDNADSPYYQSAAFGRVLNYATQHLRRCQLKEVKGRRLLRITDVPTVSEAVKVLFSIESFDFS